MLFETAFDENHCEQDLCWNMHRQVIIEIWTAMVALQPWNREGLFTLQDKDIKSSEHQTVTSQWTGFNSDVAGWKDNKINSGLFILGGCLQGGIARPDSVVSDLFFMAIDVSFLEIFFPALFCQGVTHILSQGNRLLRFEPWWWGRNVRKEEDTPRSHDWR